MKTKPEAPKPAALPERLGAIHVSELGHRHRDYRIGSLQRTLQRVTLCGSAPTALDWTGGNVRSTNREDRTPYDLCAECVRRSLGDSR